MTSDKWERLKDLFEKALACPSPAEQREFLDGSCGNDTELRAELEALLAEHSRMAEAFLEQAALDIHVQRSSPGEGTLVGAYSLIRKLGFGGMGEVYLAVRADGAYEKQVAIKLISPGGAAPELVRRFLAERQILAGLDHPNIARLLDGGTTEHGQPYLVMEYVDGIPIDRYCRAQGLLLHEKLALFERVCEALAYIHQHKVLHRDIKPSNILVTAEGTPKLLDFGIAKVLSPNSNNAQQRTVLLWGTPDYASPEQLTMRAVGPASDVYSLGVLLYELLTDCSPYHWAGRAIHEIVEVVCKEDPPPPSKAVRLRAAQDSSSVEDTPVTEEYRRRSKRLRGNLDKIVMKALQKEPKQRYQNASELLQDLRRHSAGLPVLGHPRPWLDGFLRRGRVRNAAIGLAVLAGILFLLLKPELPPPLEPVPLTGYPGTEGHPSFSPDGSQVVFSWNGEEQKNPRAPAGILHDKFDLYVKAVGVWSPARLTNNTAADLFPTWSPDGRQIAFVRNREGIFLIRPEGGGEHRILGWHNAIGQLSWFPDSRYLASASGSTDNPLVVTIIRIDTQTYETKQIVPLVRGFSDHTPAYSRDGKHLAFARCPNPDSCTLLVASIDEKEGTARGIRSVAEPAYGYIPSIAWTPDAATLVYTQGGSLRRVSVEGRSSPELLSFPGPTPTDCVAISGSGSRLAYSYKDWNPGLWAIEDGVLARSPLSSTRIDHSPQFSPDGNKVAFVSARSGNPEIWLVNRDGSDAVQLTSSRAAESPRWSPDGGHIVYSSQTADGRWDIYTIDVAGDQHTRSSNTDPMTASRVSRGTAGGSTFPPTGAERSMSTGYRPPVENPFSLPKMVASWRSKRWTANRSLTHDMEVRPRCLCNRSRAGLSFV